MVKRRLSKSEDCTAESTVKQARIERDRGCLRTSTKHDFSLSEDADYSQLLSLEVWCKIFSYLSVRDVLKVEHLCKRFQAAVMCHLRLCRTMQFSRQGGFELLPSSFTHASLGNLLRRCVQLHTILGFYPVISDESPVCWSTLQPASSPSQSTPLSNGVMSIGSSNSRMHTSRGHFGANGTHAAPAHTSSTWSNMPGSSSSHSNVLITSGCTQQMTAQCIVQALAGCSTLQNLEICDVRLLEAVLNCLPHIGIVGTFCNHHTMFGDARSSNLQSACVNGVSMSHSGGQLTSGGAHRRATRSLSMLNGASEFRSSQRDAFANRPTATGSASSNGGALDRRGDIVFPLLESNTLRFSAAAGRLAQLRCINLIGVIIASPLPRFDALETLILKWCKFVSGGNNANAAANAFLGMQPNAAGNGQLNYDPFGSFSAPELRCFVMNNCIVAPPAHAHAPAGAVQAAVQLHHGRLLQSLKLCSRLERLELIRLATIAHALRDCVEEAFRDRQGAFTRLRRVRVVVGLGRNVSDLDLGYLLIAAARQLETVCVQPSLSRDSFFGSLLKADAQFGKLRELELGFIDPFPEKGIWQHDDLSRFGFVTAGESAPQLTDYGMRQIGLCFRNLESLRIQHCPHLISPLEWIAPPPAGPGSGLNPNPPAPVNQLGNSSGSARLNQQHLTSNGSSRHATQGSSSHHATSAAAVHAEASNSGNNLSQPHRSFASSSAQSGTSLMLSGSSSSQMQVQLGNITQAPQLTTFTKLTELHMYKCYCVKVREFAQFVSMLPALERLVLELMFREEPKGCSRVGLSAGPSLGVAAALQSISPNPIAPVRQPSNVQQAAAAAANAPLFAPGAPHNNAPHVNQQPPPANPNHAFAVPQNAVNLHANAFAHAYQNPAALANPPPHQNANSNSVVSNQHAAQSNAAAVASNTPTVNAAPQPGTSTGCNSLAMAPFSADNRQSSTAGVAAAGSSSSYPATPQMTGTAAHSTHSHNVHARAHSHQHVHSASTSCSTMPSSSSAACTCCASQSASSCSDAAQQTNDCAASSSMRVTRSRTRRDDEPGASGGLAAFKYFSRGCQTDPLVAATSQTTTNNSVRLHVGVQLSPELSGATDTLASTISQPEPFVRANYTQANANAATSATPTGGKRRRAQHGWYNVIVCDRRVSTSDPVYENEDPIVEFTMRSHSIVSITLISVGVSDLNIIDCPKLECITINACRILNKIHLRTSTSYRLSRLNIADCPKFDCANVIEECATLRMDVNRTAVIQPYGECTTESASELIRKGLHSDATRQHRPCVVIMDDRRSANVSFLQVLPDFVSWLEELHRRLLPKLVDQALFVCRNESIDRFMEHFSLKTYEDGQCIIGTNLRNHVTIFWNEVLPELLKLPGQSVRLPSAVLKVTDEQVERALAFIKQECTADHANSRKPVFTKLTRAAAHQQAIEHESSGCPSVFGIYLQQP